MPSRKLYPCLICETRYAEIEDAEVCERSHADGSRSSDLTGVIHRTVHGDRACAFCTKDPCQCVDGRPAPPVPLAPEALLRLGALTLEQEQSDAVEKHLAEQQAIYQDATREELLKALEDRDRLLLQQGRQMADGRTASRLLREFMRASLYRAGGMPNVQAVQKVIEQFGAEGADARQLKLHGSTLGPLEPPEVVAGELASGERKQR